MDWVIGTGENVFCKTLDIANLCTFQFFLKQMGKRSWELQMQLSQLDSWRCHDLETFAASLAPKRPMMHSFHVSFCCPPELAVK